MSASRRRGGGLAGTSKEPASRPRTRVPRVRVWSSVRTHASRRRSKSPTRRTLTTKTRSGVPPARRSGQNLDSLDDRPSTNGRDMLNLAVGLVPRTVDRRAGGDSSVQGTRSNRSRSRWAYPQIRSRSHSSELDFRPPTRAGDRNLQRAKHQDYIPEFAGLFARSAGQYARPAPGACGQVQRRHAAPPAPQVSVGWGGSGHAYRMSVFRLASTPSGVQGECVTVQARRV